MKKYITNATDTNSKQLCEVDGTVCITSGYDKPQFINPANGTSGTLGIDLKKDYWDAPTYSAEVVGTLDETKWYTIALAPVSSYVYNSSRARYEVGAAMHHAIPVQTSVASKGIVWDIPLQDEQTITFSAGYATGGTTTTLVDTEATWTVDEWIGYRAVDNATGLFATVVSNTATALTFSAIATAPSAGNSYHITKPLITGYIVYGAEITDPSLVNGAVLREQGRINIDDTTFTLTDFTSISSALDTGIFPPPNLLACTTADNKMIAGGGIEDSTGKYVVDVTETTTDATVNAITVSIPVPYALLGQVARYTFSDASQYQTTLVVGSTVTVASSTSSGNDLTKESILRIASDGSWFEVYNSDAVAEADSTMTLSFIKNLMTGSDGSLLSQGMVGANIKFSVDTEPYGIIWVDEVAQTAGLDKRYIGAHTTVPSDGFIISANYGLYWSDSNFPHTFRIENSIDVADSIKALATINDTLLIFCKNSLYRVPLQGLGQLASLITKDVQCNAPHSVVTTPTGVYFYDGSGISVTNGQAVASVTAYKASDYLEAINHDAIDNIRGVYDPLKRRVEFAFAYGDSYENNFGLTITIDSNSCYPTQRADVNAQWLDRNEFGEQMVYHGTTNRIGDGSVWKHDPDLATDGGFTQNLSGNVTDITGQVVTADFGVVITDTITAGDPMLFLPSRTGTYN